MTPSEERSPWALVLTSSRDPSNATLVPLGSTVASLPLRNAHFEASSSPRIHSPDFVIPTGIRLYFSRLIAPITPAAVAHEISCSEDGPPKSSAMFNFDMIENRYSFTGPSEA